MTSQRTADNATRAMATIAAAVGVAAAASPDLLLRGFGVKDPQLSPAGRLGWRLFAARNLYVATQAFRGDPAAEASFTPIQGLDQVVFWSVFASRELPRRTSTLAIATSAGIVALDVVRRRARQSA